MGILRPLGGLHSAPKGRNEKQDPSGSGSGPGLGHPFCTRIATQVCSAHPRVGGLCGKFPGTLPVPGISTADSQYYLIFPVESGIATCGPTHVFLSLFLFYFVLFAENV